MKILVTGGTGFIGSHLTSALLKEGHRVRVFTRLQAKKEMLRDRFGSRVEVMVGSFEREEDLEKAVDGCEVVYHYAAIPAMRWGISWWEYEKANVLATKDLLEASAAAKIKRFIFCSSISTYGHHIRKPYLDESTPLTPDSFYGKSKVEAEKLVRLFWKEKRLPFTIIRPAIVYGPGDVGGMMLKLCRFLKTGYFVIIGNGKNSIPLVYVDDVVDLSLLCLKKAAESRIFLAASDERPSLCEVTKQAAHALGAHSPKISVPLWMATIPAVVFELVSCVTKKEPLLSRPRLTTLTSDRYFKAAEAKRVFGWSAKVGFEEGIGKTVKWYKGKRYF